MIIASKNFTFKEKFYKEGSEVKITSKEDIIKLNEKGFIEPLTYKEIQDIGKQKKKEGNKDEL